MATGDLIGARILSNTDFASQYNGSCIELTFESMSTGGTYSNFGWDAIHNVPTSSPEITINLTTYTWDGSLSVTTDSLVIYGTKQARQEYPNQSSAEEGVSGSDILIYIWLNDYVYDDDYSITVDVSAGIYNDGANNNNSASAYSVTNESTQQPWAPCAKWSWPGYNIITDTSMDLRVVSFDRDAKSGQPTKYVKFSIEDEHSNSVTSTVSTASIDSGMTDDIIPIIEYYDTFSLSGLTNGDVLTCNYIAYGHRTDSTGTYGKLDSSDAVNSQPTPQYAPQTNYYMTTASAIGHCVVDATNGSDITGTVYASQASAESAWSGDTTTAFQTIGAALTGIASYQSWANAGGGHIYLTAESHDLNTANGGATYSAWITIQPMTGHDNTDTTISIPGTNSAIPNMCKLYNLYVSSSNYWRGFNTDLLWLDKCDMNTTGTLTAWQLPVAYATYLTGSMARHFRTYSTSVTPWAIIRGCDMDSAHYSYGFCTIGNNNVIVREKEGGNPVNYYGIYAFNICYALGSLVRAVDLYPTDDNTYGFAMVQNLIESIASVSTPVVWICADSSTTAVNNIIIWHNTITGERGNFGYNDSGSTAYFRRGWSQRGNIFLSWNNKGDLFAPENGTRVGGWPITNMIGGFGNLLEGSGSPSFAPEWEGLSTNYGGIPDYIDDQSGSGNPGGGDYRLNYDSEAIELLLEVNKCLSYDIEGTARGTNTSAGAYEYISGTSYQRSISDSIGLSDSLSRINTYNRSISESIGISDSLVRITNIFRSISGNAGLGDSLSRSFNGLRSISDSIGLNDALSRSQTLYRSIIDAIGLFDNLSRIAIMFRSISNIVGLTDILVWTKLILRSITDTIGLTDSLSRSHGFSRSISDDIGITDVLNRVAQIVRSISNSIGLSDLLSSTSTSVTVEYVRLQLRSKVNLINKLKSSANTIIKLISRV